MKQKGIYGKAALTAILTVCAILIFYDTFFGSRTLIALLKKLLDALTPILLGSLFAYLLSPVINFFDRETADVALKQQLAMRALEFLEPDQLVAIDGSSTNLQFAKNIPDNLKLTVLTNSYSIAHVCSLKEQIRVIILGGDLLKDSMTTVGEVAAAQAAGYHPDLCFMGVYAIHPEYGMTIPYPEEVSIKRQLIRSSSRVIALVNPAKLNTVSRYQVCGIEDFTTLITDGHVPQEMASRYKNRGLDFL